MLFSILVSLATAGVGDFCDDVTREQAQGLSQVMEAASRVAHGPIYWKEDAEESAAAWSRLLEGAMPDGFEVHAIHCEEYPCLLQVRGPNLSGEAPADAFEPLLKVLTERTHLELGYVDVARHKGHPLLSVAFRDRYLVDSAKAYWRLRFRHLRLLGDRNGVAPPPLEHPPLNRLGGCGDLEEVKMLTAYFSQVRQFVEGQVFDFPNRLYSDRVVPDIAWRVAERLGFRAVGINCDSYPCIVAFAAKEDGANELASARVQEAFAIEGLHAVPGPIGDDSDGKISVGFLIQERGFQPNSDELLFRDVRWRGDPAPTGRDWTVPLVR